MKIKIKREITEEVEVTFPLFTKSLPHFYIFKSENECVSITAYSDAVKVEKHAKNCFPESWMLHEECSADEFYDAFKKAMSELNELI